MSTSGPRYGTALVTGGSSGIGQALVCALARRFRSVVIADPVAPQEPPANAVYHCTDITEREDISSLYSSTISQSGIPDLIVCNAGRGIHELLSEGDPEQWQDILHLNIMGTLRVVRAFLPSMLQAGGGDIVVISSVSARRTYPWGGVYAASKAALEMIAETLRLELQPTIRVTTIAPGVVDTPFFRHATGYPPTPAELGWGALPPEEIAGAVLYAIERPRDVAVSHITLRPAAQPL